MVALYDEMGESRNSLKYAKQALDMDKNIKEYLLNDSRLKEDLKQKIKEL
ncbi:MAG: hypothetical protein WBJ13_12880 [Sedimentibacter sp.]